MNLMPRSSEYDLPCSIHRRPLKNGGTSFVAKRRVSVDGTTKRPEGQGRNIRDAVVSLVIKLRSLGAEWEAEELLEAAVDQYGQGVLKRLGKAAPSGPQLLAAVYENQTARLHDGHIRPDSYDRNIGRIRNHLEDHPVAKKTLGEITTDDLRAYFRHLTNKKNTQGKPLLGPTPKRSIHGILNQVLVAAVEEGTLDRNPLDPIKRPKKPTENRSAAAKRPEIVKAVRLASQALPYEQYLSWLPQMLGVRVSERLGFQHRAFTFLAQQSGVELHIQRQYNSDRKEFVEILKTGASYRSLGLPQAIRPHLDALYLRRVIQAHQLGQFDPRIELGISQPGSSGALRTPYMQDETPVWLNARGEPLRRQTVQKQWEKLKAEYLPDDPDMVAHGFRHIAGRYLASQKFPTVTIDAYLGHATDKEVTSVYIEPDWADLAEAAAALVSHYLRWPEPLPMHKIPKGLLGIEDDPIGSRVQLEQLWRSPDIPEEARMVPHKGRMVHLLPPNHSQVDPQRLDTHLRHHGSSLVSLAYFEAWKPQELRVLSWEQSEWAREHSPKWPEELVTPAVRPA